MAIDVLVKHWYFVIVGAVNMKHEPDKNTERLYIEQHCFRLQ